MPTGSEAINGGQPCGELSLRTVAMPADTNPAGDIFGGWIMSLMDLAAGVAAGTRAKGRVATAAVSNLSFLRPVKVGDVVCVYTAVRKTGRTSVTVGVEAWVLRRNQGNGRRLLPGKSCWWRWMPTARPGRCRPPDLTSRAKECRVRLMNVSEQVRHG